MVRDLKRWMLAAGRSSRLLSVKNQEKSHVSAVAVLIRQAWQDDNPVATLLDEPRSLTEKRAVVRWDADLEKAVVGRIQGWRYVLILTQLRVHGTGQLCKF